MPPDRMRDEVLAYVTVDVDDPCAAPVPPVADVDVRAPAAECPLDFFINSSNNLE